MVKYICSVFLAIGFLSTNYLQAEESAPLTVTASDLNNGQITFTAHATVDSLFSVEIQLTDLSNLRPSKEGKLIFNLDGSGDTELMTLDQIEVGGGWGYYWSYWWNYGFSGENQDSNYTYRIPYASKDRFTVGQGYMGSWSHQDTYAIDWSMPEGTTIYAARGGKVIKTKEDSNEGGAKKSFMDKANYVTIGHLDGSKADYLHLQQNGALVQIGATVKIGDPIGLSGNTGWSTEPHLHFQVFHQTDPQTSSTVSTNFLGKDGNVVSIQEGDSYYGSGDVQASTKTFANANAVADSVSGWSASPWLGSFFTSASNWIYHENLGWLYPVDTAQEGVWLYHPNLNWVWTSKNTYPWLYFYDKKNWIYFESSKGFYDYSQGAWSPHSTHEESSKSSTANGSNASGNSTNTDNGSAETENSSSSLDIIFDYRYDNGYFSANPDRKTALEYAAKYWESVITSSHTVAPGTSLNMRRSYTSTESETISYENGVPGFLVFLYAYDFQQEVNTDGTPSPSTSKAVGSRFSTPNVGALYLNANAGQSSSWFFDATPETANDIPSKTHYDFVETALHELGHVLGILRSYQAPFVTTDSEGQESFDGPAVRQVNNGQALPLDKDSSHVYSKFTSPEYLPMPNLDRHSMHGSNVIQGFRSLPTPIDVAMLDDIGYDVNYAAIPKSVYGDPAVIKQYQASNPSSFVEANSSTKPHGLWIFDTLDDVDKALVGYPLRYMPPAGQTGLITDLHSTDHLSVPKNGYLIVNHTLSEAIGPGSDVTIYSLLLDLRIKTASPWRALFNTNPYASNDGEMFITGDMKIGASGLYSEANALSLNNWHRIIFTFNANTSTAKIYVDGNLALTNASISQSRYGLYSAESNKPLLLLLGDDDGDSDAVDLKAAALYGEELSDPQALRLGGVQNRSFGL
jgi:murein DD-endopeptidase MepM/ murein hydrolase activator NlpD